MKIEKLKWIYPIKAFAVINAISKASPFILECMVRKRLEKRMEVIISDVSSYSSGMDKSAVKLRSITPQNGCRKSIDNLIIIGKFSKINSFYNLFCIFEPKILFSIFIGIIFGSKILFIKLDK